MYVDEEKQGVEINFEHTADITVTAKDIFPLTRIIKGKKPNQKKSKTFFLVFNLQSNLYIIFFFSP